MRNNKKIRIIVNSDRLIINDIRDIISFLLFFIKEKKSKSSDLVFYDLSENKNFFIKFARLIQSEVVQVNSLPESKILNFAKNGEEFFIFEKETYDVIKSENVFNKIKLIDINLFYSEKNQYDNEKFIFRKNHEQWPSKKIKNKFLYISGYCPAKPNVNAHIIAPKWSWLSTNDTCMSGINFVSHIYNNYYKLPIPKNKFRKYRCIYIGSSSVNKNAILSIILIISSRILAFFKKINIKPDQIIITRFYGLKGNLIWIILNILRIFIKISFLNIKIILSSKKLSQTSIYEFQKDSDYGLISYFREGCPRVLGEYIYCNTFPLIWSFSKFGNNEIKRFYNFNKIKDIISILTYGVKNKLIINRIGNGDEIMNIENRVATFLDKKEFLFFKEHIDLFPSNRKHIIIYTLLTADISYLK